MALDDQEPDRVPLAPFGMVDSTYQKSRVYLELETGELN